MSSTTRAVVLCLALTGCGVVYDGTAKPFSPPEVTARPIASVAGHAAARGSAGAFSGPLTLPQAVEIALENNLRLRSADLERTKALAAVKEARRSFLPTLSAKASYMRLDETPGFSTEGPPPMEMEIGELDNYSVSLSLSQPIWMGGKMRLGLRATRVASRLAGLGYSLAEQGVVFLVEKGYYDVLLAEEDVKASEEAEELARRHVQDTKRRFEGGTATQFEVTRAEVRTNGATAELIRSRNALRLARASFLDLLRVPLGTEFELADKLVHQPLQMTAEDAFDEAAGQRPDLAAAAKRLALQRLKVEATRREYFPNIMLVGDLGTENPSQGKTGAEGWDPYWNLGIVLTCPVFEGGRISAKLEGERAALRQAGLAVEQLRDSIRLEITQAMLTLSDAEEFIRSQEKAVEQAEEGLRLAKVGYENGVLTQLDVLDAQMGLTQVRKLHAQALYGHMMARLALGRAIGRP